MFQARRQGGFWPGVIQFGTVLMSTSVIVTIYSTAPDIGSHDITILMEPPWEIVDWIEKFETGFIKTEKGKSNNFSSETYTTTYEIKL